MTESTIADIEKSIAEAKELVDFAKSVERLRNNKDFKKVVLDGYFTKEAVRLVHLKSDPSTQDPVSQAGIISAIDAIGNFSSFLTVATQDGNIAAKQIKDSEDMRDELLEEELGE